VVIADLRLHPVACVLARPWAFARRLIDFDVLRLIRIIARCASIGAPMSGAKGLPGCGATGGVAVTL